MTPTAPPNALGIGWAFLAALAAIASIIVGAIRMWLAK
jgi:hypothetical protein